MSFFTDAQESEIKDTPFNKQNDLEEFEEDDDFHLITSPVSGILKGGLLWKHHGCNLMNDNENVQVRYKNCLRSRQDLYFLC